MSEPVRKFLFRLLILTLVLTCAGYGLFAWFLRRFYFSLFPVIPVFLFSITFAFHLYLVRAGKNDPRKFISRYLGAMGLKLAIYLVFIVIILAADTSHAVAFLVSFLVMYSAFTLFEVISILNTLKNRP